MYPETKGHTIEEVSVIFDRPKGRPESQMEEAGDIKDEDVKLEHIHCEELEARK